MLKGLVRHNLWLKASALALAVALWFFVLLRTQSEISMEIEPEIRNLPEDYCLMEKKPASVTVVVRGNERLLARLKPSDVRLSVSMPEPKEGRMSVPVSAGDVKLPPHTGLVSMSPSEVRVSLARRIGLVKLPVKPSVTGRPAKGYAVDRIEVSPESVEVRCLREEFRSLASLSTSPIDVSGAENDITEDAAVISPDRTAMVEPEQVTVKIRLRKL
jgi:YbbR domain-containing protein